MKKGSRMQVSVEQLPCKTNYLDKSLQTGREIVAKC